MNFQRGFEKLMATRNVSVPFGKCDQSIILTFEMLRILPPDFGGTAEIV